MPEMDGMTLLESLQSYGNIIPILVLTADIQDTTRDRCVALGARDVMHKQFNQKLISNIESMLNEGA
jgi:twitching motility two-component system response regulator PilH